MSEPEQPDEFCPRCFCDACIAYVLAADAEEKRILKHQNTVKAKKEAIKNKKLAQQAELMRMSAMIWMLVNQATDHMHAQKIMYDIAVALDMTTAEVNARRRMYTDAIFERQKDFINKGWTTKGWNRLNEVGVIPGPVRRDTDFAKIPGTRGTEQPEYCETCGSWLMSKQHNVKPFPCRTCNPRKT